MPLACQNPDKVAVTAGKAIGKFTIPESLVVRSQISENGTDIVTTEGYSLILTPSDFRQPTFL